MAFVYCNSPPPAVKICKSLLCLCALILAAVASRAQAPSRVRAELVAALDGKAAALSSQAPLREVAALFLTKEKAEARTRLDGLDRAHLSPAELRELSEAYVLLGYFDAGAQAGRALQEREPLATHGFKLAAAARLEEKDYAGAVEAAQEALKIDPQDRDAAALLHVALGRTRASRSAPDSVDPAAPPPTSGTQYEPRSPQVFAPRPKRDGMGAAVPLPIEEVNEAQGMISRSAEWTKGKIDGTIQAIVKHIGRSVGLRAGEEETALTGARVGGIVGGGVGLAGGVLVAAPVCGPALVTGAPYGACVIAGGAGGALVVAPAGAYAGGWGYVNWKRGVAVFSKNFGFTLDDSDKAE